MTIAWKYFFLFLTLFAATVWLVVFTYTPDFKIIACDVGQGDAILATYQKTQVLVDGGPNRSVMDCLSRHMPFWDRTIEVVLLTHPQKDHYMGLINVFESYDVQLFVTSGLDSSAQEYQVLKSLVTGKGVRVVNPESGMEVRSDLIHLDILHPSDAFLAQNSQEQFSNLTIGKSGNNNGVLGAFTSRKDPNEFSIVSILSYKDFDALLTGDISPDISNLVAEQLALSGSRRVEYIKVPHHGSKNGLTEELLDAAAPEVAVISVGRGNSYGHPHKEVLDLLTSYGLRVLRTDEKGDVVFESNGESWRQSH